MVSKIRQGKKEHHICQEVKLFLFVGDIMTIYIENSLEFEKKKKKTEIPLQLIHCLARYSIQNQHTKILVLLCTKNEQSENKIFKNIICSNIEI